MLGSALPPWERIGLMSELRKPRLKLSHGCWPVAGSLMATGTGVRRDSRSSFPGRGKGQRAGRDVLCDTHGPTPSWDVLAPLTGNPQPWVDSHHSHPLAQFCASILGGEDGSGGRPPHPQVCPYPVCPCRAGARLSYQAWVCPAIVLGLGMGHMPLEWGRPLCLHPARQADTQPCHGTTHGQTPATVRVTVGSSMSPSPRCSAASLVNWESEMKHCSSGREELRTLGTSETPHPLGQVMQGELTPGYTEGLTPKLQIAAESVRACVCVCVHVSPCSRGTPVSAQDPHPGTGHQQEGSYRNVGALCSRGTSRDAAAAPPPPSATCGAQPAARMHKAGREPRSPCPRGPVFPGIP
ncbi:uncharacterized protein LOC142364009 isoform X1 [Opisthocomus hoazin]|uniref:uncharacterized protein LOC142364009 isoform X1 n=1 Tax=Opisthocomus hoazin TaxID=30419 RepID=UPI003F5365E5